MDFFKSVFSPDPDPSDSPSDSPRHPHDHDDGQQEEPLEEDDEETPNPNPNPSPSHSSGSWNWLVKTIATKSESVIETYRRDLEEFGYGLKKETEAIKKVATRAVRDLPGSLEAGASVAQESIESVGHAIDEFGGSVWRGTAEIISHGKEALLAVDSDSGSPGSNPPSSSKRYGRFEVQVLALQNDPNTYAEEPEDGENFGKWKLGFRLEEKEDEIEGLLYDNGVLEGLFEKFVPGVLDQETFWSRYFYRVYKLKQAEDARAKFVARVISREEDEDEELSWEVDDDEDKKEEENKNENKKEEVESKKETEKEEENKNENKKEAEKLTERGPECVEENKPTEEAKKEEIVETELAKEDVGEPLVSEEEKKPTEASQVENLDEEENVKSNIEENRSPSEAISERTESSKDSDFSVVSSQPSMQEEEDLEWDEIEDLGEHDDKKVEGSGGSPRKVDLRKRLSAAEEDEDLSWDIDDDEDEPMKT